MTDKKNKTILVTGGGTGGHIYPALAVIDELQKHNTVIYYVGNPKNPEFELAKSKNITFLPVNVSGMPRKISLKLVFWIITLFTSIIKSGFYCLKYKPDIVFGTGGYVSAPILFAAKFLKIPYALHDADAQPGIVTRCFASRAKVLTTPFEIIKKLVPAANIIVTGNPVREEFSTISKEDARQSINLDDKITLLIMGGSQGARSINHAVIPILKQLIDKYDINIIHQSGKKNYNETIEMLNTQFKDWKNKKNYRLLSYIDNMPSILKSADIAISRSGSLSLSEMKAAGVASILIPYPFAAGDHQKKNAIAMVEEGCSIMIEDKDLSPETLYESLNNILNSSEILTAMKNNSIKKAMPDATKQIAKILMEL